MKTKIISAVFAGIFATTACSKEEPKATTAVVETQKVIKTKEDVKAFQRANGLAPDGIAGPKTQALMKQKGYRYEPAKPAAKPAKPAKKELILKEPPGKAIK